MTPTTFLKCFNKGERWKYAGKEVCLNWVWNSQPPGHEFDMVTTEPSWWGTRVLEFNALLLYGKKVFRIVLHEYFQCFDLCNPIEGIFYVTKLKAFANDKLNVTKLNATKMTIFLFHRIENTIGKRRKIDAGYQHFLLFQQCFPKPGSLKVGIVWLKSFSLNCIFLNV